MAKWSSGGLAWSQCCPYCINKQQSNSWDVRLPSPLLPSPPLPLCRMSMRVPVASWPHCASCSVNRRTLRWPQRSNLSGKSMQQAEIRWEGVGGARWSRSGRGRGRYIWSEVTSSEAAITPCTHHGSQQPQTPSAPLPLFRTTPP